MTVCLHSFESVTRRNCDVYLRIRSNGVYKQAVETCKYNYSFFFRIKP